VEMTDIYSYLDYHCWLSDAFKQKKEVSASFSHRFIAQKLGLKSSGYILYVMQGKRKLTEDTALRIAQIFSLSRAQTEYFLQLIRYENAKSSQEKQFQFERLAALRRRQVKKVEPEAYRFYEKWYYPVVREVLALVPFDGDFNVLAEMVVPSITVSEAAEAVKLLCDLGMVVEGEDGIYHKKDAVVSTGDVWQSAVIREHQKTLIEKGKEALDRVSKTDRDISNLTITASAETLGLIAQRISHLRAEILELARNEKNPDRVLNCNFMVFPVAQKKEQEQ